ncbi:MAG: hypothetical protein PHQ23_12435 [Candidatus Wallbacteria bacterium]|nr:hypothetical protein [Candidatus Wallbacteria bacterium]
MSRLALFGFLFICFAAYSGSVPGFSPVDNVPVFTNFTLSDMRIWNNIERVSSKNAAEKFDNFDREMEFFFQSLPAVYFLNNAPSCISLPSSAERSSILESMGYAHCWGMAYVTKMFFEYARFTGRQNREESMQDRVRYVSKGYYRNFPYANLNSFSRNYEHDIKEVVAEWQAKLLFNPLNLPFLFSGNQRREFDKIRHSIDSDQLLTLVQLKASLSWMHVVLAYRIEGNTIYVYDSNYPCTTDTKLYFEPESGRFRSAQYDYLEANFIDN